MEEVPGDAMAAPEGSDHVSLWFPHSVRILVVVIIIGAILGLVFTSKWMSGRSRSDVAKAMSDMRMLATAVETYYVDNMQYPAMTLNPAHMPDGNRYPKGVPFGRTFRTTASASLVSLTTPIAYITDYPTDPFTEPHKLVYRYYREGSFWILASFGPDRDMKTGGQLEWPVGDIVTPWDGRRDSPPAVADSPLERLYPFRTTSSLPTTLPAGEGPNGSYTYDPTNGTRSDGDLWRVKQ